MSHVIFTNVTAILPERLLPNACVVCKDGCIASIHQGPIASAISGGEIIDGQGAFLSPGFVDIHVHGGKNFDFMDGSTDAVRGVCRAHALHGTTTLFPTSTTGSNEQIMAMIMAVKHVQAEQARFVPPIQARIAGVHLYGPFFAPDKTGCHSTEQSRPPLAAEYSLYFQTGAVRIATCAAELPGASDFYREAHRLGCFITCGHSNANWSEMATAFDLGMRHVDHFWCAMSSVSSVRSRCGVPMRGSMLEFVLGNVEMSTEVIADGCHLAPELLDFAFRFKGCRRLCLVTDCNRALDMPPGEYRFGSNLDGPYFRSDGCVGWSPSGGLASGVVGMDHMVRQMRRDTSASLTEVIRMASLTPAERTGIADRVGSIEVGKQADFVLLNDRLEVQRVFVGGIS